MRANRAMRAIIIGTGPSLTQEAIDLVNGSDLPKFGCNNVYQVVPALTAHLACNVEWWNHYGVEVCRRGFDKWTWDKPTADKWGIHYIRGEWGDGLSTDPGVIHYGHSSGYQLINLAYHYGVREFVLIGYDLRYPKGYDGRRQVAGGDRHYFGEYPKSLQHWTKFGMGENGELGGLLKCYRTLYPQAYQSRIINCSPGSALDFFETGELAEWV
jgi:hypothetical protein